MRWDDLALLRLIDELEEREPSSLGNGIALLQKASDGRPINWGRDEAPFARELSLASSAGLVEWSEPNLPGMVGPDPTQDSNSWLQHIRELRLTIPGRDRARGRVVLRPLPDPDEDDDRPIAGMTLEDVARAIADTYTAAQIPRFLVDSGIPESFVSEPVTGDKWQFVLNVLEALHEGGSSARRALRAFIGQWLERRLHTWPRDDIRKKIIAQLGQQGWHVKDACLVIGEQTFDALGALTLVGRDARVAALHADVRAVAERYIQSDHMAVAVFEAFKAVNNRVKQMSALSADGSDLMGQAFSDTNPRIILADLDTQTGRNIQTGFRFLFMGAARGIRNPDAHEQFRNLSVEEGLEMLGFASLLMRHLDGASIRLPEVAP